eukprot:GHVR01096265.1.p1 GENE.GHVR01096265.1~~GHVR01096265.1.p1  ORF type:complete len:404 (-),score=14.43 GHVR01096265.1:723-1934(-)
MASHSHRCRSLVGHKDTVVSVNSHQNELSCNYNLLASSSEDRTLRVWDYRTERAVRCFTDGALRSDAMGYVQFHPSEPYLFLGHSSSLVLFDLRQSSVIVRERQSTVFLSPENDEDDEFSVNSFSFHPCNHDMIACPLDSNELRLVNWRENRITASSISRHTNIVATATFRGIPMFETNNKLHSSIIPRYSNVEVLSGGYDQQLCRWDSETMRHLKTIKSHSLTRENDGACSSFVNPPFVLSLCTCHDGSLLAAGIGNGAVVVMQYSGSVMNHIPILSEHAHLGQCVSLCFCPLSWINLSGESSYIDAHTHRPCRNGHTLISVGSDSQMIIWKQFSNYQQHSDSGTPARIINKRERRGKQNVQFKAVRRMSLACKPNQVCTWGDSRVCVAGVDPDIQVFDFNS